LDQALESYILRQEFEGDEAVDLYIWGLVNHTHATPAELVDDAVVRDDLAKQVEESTTQASPDAVMLGVK
jgi:hypothetical protein